MKYLAYLTIMLVLMLSASSVFAGEPVVSHNVQVGQGMDASQCGSSWEGEGGPDTEISTSGYGQNTELTSPVVRSCTGCAYNSANKSCVCDTCYDRFDDLQG